MHQQRPLGLAGLHRCGFHQAALGLPALFQLGQAPALGLQLVLGGLRAGGGVQPYGILAGDDRQFDVQGGDAPAAVFDFGGDGVLADGDAGAGGV